MVGEHELCGCEVATDDKQLERKEGVQQTGRRLAISFHWLFSYSH